MKRRIPLLFLVAGISSAALVGCQNESHQEELLSRSRSDAHLREVSIFTPAGTGMTRTSFQNDTGTYNVYWTTGDKLGVFSANTTNAEFTLQFSGESTVEFQGSIAGAPLYAYYPYSSSAGSDATTVSGSLPSTQAQQFDSGNPIPDPTLDMKAGLPTAGDAGDAENGYKFTFTQKNTLLHFVITPDSHLDGDALQNITFTVEGASLAGSYTIDITSAGNAPVFAAGAAESVTLTFDGTSLTSGTAVEGWMYINPDIDAEEDISITVNTDRHIVRTLSAKAGTAFELGKVYDIAMDIATLLSSGKVEIESLTEWYEDANVPGVYDLSTEAEVTALHQYAEYEDQTWSMTSAGKRHFCIQGLKNGKLSRISFPASASLALDSNVTVDLYTIYDDAGAVTTDSITCKVIKSESGKCWLESLEGNIGFIVIVEE